MLWFLIIILVVRRYLKRKNIYIKFFPLLKFSVAFIVNTPIAGISVRKAFELVYSALILPNLTFLIATHLRLKLRHQCQFTHLKLQIFF